LGDPINRTAKTALDANLVNSVTSDATKIAANNDVLYDYVDGLNAAQDAHASNETMAHPDGSVTTVKIRDANVTTAKIADGAVTRPKIAAGAVGSSQLDATLLTNFGDIAVQAEFDRRGVDVLKYGADPSGLTDSTSAFSSAISASNGSIIVPSGTFKISSLTINKPLSIYGSGLKNSILLIDNTLNNVGIRITTNWINLFDICIKSSGTKADGNNVQGVLYDKGSSGSIGYSQVERVQFLNFSGSGLSVVNAIDLSISRINTSGNTIGISSTNGYGTSGGTTINIIDHYSSNDTTSITLNNTTTSLLIRPIFEFCNVGVLAVSSRFTTYSPYFENVTTYDHDLTDAIMTKIGDGRTDKGDRINWVNQGSTSRGGNEFSRYDTRTQKFSMYEVRGLREKELRAYTYIDDSDARNTGGYKYDGSRILPFITAQNMLRIDSWNYPYDTNKKAVYFHRTGGGDPAYCYQTVNLPAASYQFVAGIETTGTIGLSQTSTFVVTDTGGNVIYTHATDPSATQADERLQLLDISFTILLTADYQIRIYSNGSPMSTYLYGPCLFRTDRTTSPNTAHDEAMRNCFILIGHLSTIQSGYDYMGDGKKTIYGTRSNQPATTTGYKEGDRYEYTDPIAGGYSGVKCLANTWKGYGMLES
jgi:hypothetical protein